MNITTQDSVKAKKVTGKKIAKEQIELVGLEAMSALDEVIKSLGLMRAEIETKVKEQEKSYFINTGAKNHTRPANFVGFEGIATASCELRNRGANSALSDDEKALLTKYEIPIKELPISPETYSFNPAYLSAEWLSKISEVMPTDFIVKHPGTSKTLVDETAFEVLFTKSKKTIEMLLEVVGSVAIKSSVLNKQEEALNIIEHLLFPTPEPETVEISVDAPL